MYKPTEYLYGEDERVLTHLELEERITAGDEKVTKAKSLVMIQCVGCRNKDRNYCSRVCCSESIKNALKLKEINPEMDIYILFRISGPMGLWRIITGKASENDVKFIRYEPEGKPRVQAVEEAGQKSCGSALTDPILGQELGIDADIIALAAAVLPPADNKELSQSFKVALGRRVFQGSPRQTEAGGVCHGRRLSLRNGPLSQAHPGSDQPGLRSRGPGPDPSLPRYRHRLGFRLRGEREKVHGLRGLFFGLHLRGHRDAQDKTGEQGRGESGYLQGRRPLQRQVPHRGHLPETLYR